MERANTLLVMLVVMVCSGGVSQAHRTIYVDDDAASPGDGSTWETAYTYLQDALMVAQSGDQILVAQGVYRPDGFVLSLRPNLGRMETFRLKSGVEILGGFAGIGAPDPNVRDVSTYRSALSGDLSESLPELTPDNYADLLMTRGTDDYRNSFHVVTAGDTDASAVLDGFVITGGTANGPAFGIPDEPHFFRGAGIYMESGSATFRDCTITGNIAFVYNGPAAEGAGMYCLHGSPTLIRCKLVMNRVDDYDSDAHGAGITVKDSDLTLIGCYFQDNATLNWGGAIAIQGTGAALAKDCRFIGNWAQYGGGGIWNAADANGVLTVEGCLFAGNRAGYRGAAIRSWDARCLLRNCTFVGNRDYPVSFERGQAINCIFDDGQAEDPADFGLVMDIRYSRVEAGWPGEGNIHVDPCFVEPGYWDPNGTPEDLRDDIWVNGDYHLKSQAGRWDPAGETWIRDEATSLCIDAGDPMSPIGHEPFPNGGVVNMGAYAGTAEASKSYFGGPPCETIVAGDINGDCRVDFLDLTLMGLHWSQQSALSP